MRFISVAGILLLLLLQYFWVQNAYRMVERDLMEKSKECLREAIDEELYQRLNQSRVRISVKDKSAISKGPVLSSGQINNQSDVNISLQDLELIIGNQCKVKHVDSLFTKEILKKLGFIPRHSVIIISNSKRIIRCHEFNDSIKKSEKIIGNTIFIQLNSKQSVELKLTSPTLSVITKALYIFIVSILLVLLLGIILIFQYKSMLKDKEFGAFLKDFSRVLAHELRTPINDIYLLISTVLSKDFTDDQKIEQYQEESLNQCSKMLLSIDNILLIAKSELSKISVLKSQIDMRPFIEGIVDKYRDHYFMGKTLNIETECLTEDCSSFIDPELMENVLINLIENAIKYSYEKVNIHIIFSVENNHLLLRVKDDGFGISKSNMKNIFKIFGRGSKMDYRQIKGFGIGLFYVQKVIKSHNGTIEVTSEEGKGNEFIMDIPSRF